MVDIDSTQPVPQEPSVPQPFGYVTFAADGSLDGSFFQVPPAGHAENIIQVDEDVRASWVLYRANDARDGVELVPAAPPAPPAVPEEISPRQFRQALNKFGYRQRVDDAIAASSDQDLKDFYEFTTAFQRHHPEVLAMAESLGFAADQMDAVWTYGAALP